MSDRHSKWVRVQPGTVIPAGQPYRVEEHRISERVPLDDWTFTSCAPGDEVFVDSSWKPPLVLPTEPGSVIEATFKDQPAHFYMRGLRGRKSWVDGDVGGWYGDDELSLVRVLFDAGRGERGKDALVSWEAIDKLRKEYPPQPGAVCTPLDYFLREVVGDR